MLIQEQHACVEIYTLLVPLQQEELNQWCQEEHQEVACLIKWLYCAVLRCAALRCPEDQQLCFVLAHNSLTVSKCHLASSKQIRQI